MHFTGCKKLKMKTRTVNGAFWLYLKLLCQDLWVLTPHCHWPSFYIACLDILIFWLSRKTCRPRPTMPTHSYASAISDIKSWTTNTWEYYLPPSYLQTPTCHWNSGIKFFTKGTFVWGYLNCCILPWTIVPYILITYLSTVEFTIISLRTKSPKNKVPHTLEL